MQDLSRIPTSDLQKELDNRSGFIRIALLTEKAILEKAISEFDITKACIVTFRQWKKELESVNRELENLKP